MSESIDPRYPIGRFQKPAGWSPELAAEWIERLSALPAELRAAVDGLNDGQLDTPYREGGWTVRQVVHHLADSHTHAWQRTRHTLTEDGPTVAGYDESVWAELVDARTLSTAPSLAILDGVHARWTALLRTLDQQGWERAYFHSGYQDWYPLWRAGALYAWHGKHHTAHITELKRRNGW